LALKNAYPNIFKTDPQYDFDLQYVIPHHQDLYGQTINQLCIARKRNNFGLFIQRKLQHDL
jgi:hypothetical protein